MDPIEMWSAAYNDLKAAIKLLDAKRGAPEERAARQYLGKAIKAYNEASENLPDA